jgi:predicted nucleic acid-binding Zn ribbon protein
MHSQLTLLRVGSVQWQFTMRNQFGNNAQPTHPGQRRTCAVVVHDDESVWQQCTANTQIRVGTAQWQFTITKQFGNNAQPTHPDPRRNCAVAVHNEESVWQQRKPTYPGSRRQSAALVRSGNW